MNDMILLLKDLGPDVFKIAASVLAGAVVNHAVAPQMSKYKIRRQQRRHNEQFPGLTSILSDAFTIAVCNTVFDEYDGSVSRSDWARYANPDWTAKLNTHVLEPLTGIETWPVWADALVSGDKSKVSENLLIRMRNTGLDTDELSDQLSIQIDNLLYWLGPSIAQAIDSFLSTKAKSPDEFADVYARSSLRDTTISNAVATLSPSGLRRQLRKYLETTTTACKSRQVNPFLPEIAPHTSLRQTARVRVNARPDVASLPGFSSESFTSPSLHDQHDGTRTVPWDLYGSTKNIVILSGPGLGKTSLLRQHAIDLADSALRAMDERVTPSELILPIFVRCDQIHGHENPSLEESCVQVLKVASEHSGSEQQAFATWLTNHLKSSYNIFLLDGLDEISRTTLALPFAQKLENWVHTNGHGQIIITSRIAGYEHPHGIELFEAELLPLSTVDIDNYVNRFPLDSASREKIFSLLEDHHFIGMARIPLMLAMICAAAYHNRDIPRRRSELYAMILEELLNETHRRRELPDTTSRQKLSDVEKNDLYRILGEVAFHFSSIPGKFFRMPAGELKEIIIGAKPLTPDILNIAIQAGILVRDNVELFSASSNYSFIHPVIGEYLAAITIATKKKRLKRAIDQHLWFDANFDQILPLIGGNLKKPKFYLQLLLGAAPDPLNHALHTASLVVAELSDAQIVSVTDEISVIATRLIKIFQNDEMNKWVDLTRQRAMNTTMRASLDVIAIAGLVHDPTVRIELIRVLEESIRPVGLACQILARIGGPEATAALLTALYNPGRYVEMMAEEGSITRSVAAPDPFIQRAAATALGSMQGELVTEILLAALSKGDTAVRRAAINGLAVRPGRSVAIAINDALTDDDIVLRQIAVWGLGSRRKKGAKAVLLNALTSKELQVRQTAILTIAAHQDEEYVKALKNTLEHDESPLIRIAAAKALSDKHGQKVTNALLKSLRKDLDPAVRARAAASLGHRPEDPRVTKSLLNALKHGDPDVQRKAATALTTKTGKKVTTALVSALQGLNTRDVAATALSSRTGSAVTEALLLAFTSSQDFSDKSAILRALGPRHEPPVTATLVKAMSDPQWRVKVIDALSNQTRADATTALLDALDDPEPNTQLAAALALGSHPAQEITDVLLTALSCPDPTVYSSIALANRPAKDVIAGLSRIIQTSTDEKLRQIYYIISPFAWSINTMAKDERQSMLKLLGILTERVNNCFG